MMWVGVAAAASPQKQALASRTRGDRFGVGNPTGWMRSSLLRDARGQRNRAGIDGGFAVSETEAERKPKKPGTFGKGNPGRRGHPKPNPGSELAADMERAYGTAESPTDSPGVKAARKLALEDYPRFVATYAKLKDAAVKQGNDVLTKESVAAATTNAVPGENEVKVGELIEKLLLEWEAEGGTK